MDVENSVLGSVLDNVDPGEKVDSRDTGGVLEVVDGRSVVDTMADGG